MDHLELASLIIFNKNGDSALEIHSLASIQLGPKNG